MRIPAGVGFDPGGIGKGLAADLVADETMAGGALGVCVNMGGDLRVRGRSPDSESWTVAVEHQLAPEPVVMVALSGGCGRDVDDAAPAMDGRRKRSPPSHRSVDR